MSKELPKLLFVGAGNIAQSIMKGIIRAKPAAANQILATAPTLRNLDIVKQTLGCQTTLLKNATNQIAEFRPEFVFLCVKPQVLTKSLSGQDSLFQLLKMVSPQCITLSLLAGTPCSVFTAGLQVPRQNIVRVMLNTAAELGSSNVIYYADQSIEESQEREMESLFKLLSKDSDPIRVANEQLMDVATGICGSGIAFFYEIIQSISDTGVKNGLNRADATSIASQLSKSAGEMVMTKQLHPYHLRDQVTSPAGTTITGLSSWHEQLVNVKISQSLQASIDKAKELANATK